MLLYVRGRLCRYVRLYKLQCYTMPFKSINDVMLHMYLGLTCMD